MLWRLMMISCACVALQPASGTTNLYGDVEPRWQREVRALLEASNWLQPSGPGHGRSSRGFNRYEDDEEEQDQDRDLEDSSTGRIDGVNKRALSALSRWKPFSSAWGTRGLRPFGRAPLAAALLPRDADLVSAETRNNQERPKGQPLRWGRRRR